MERNSEYSNVGIIEEDTSDTIGRWHGVFNPNTDDSVKWLIDTARELVEHRKKSGLEITTTPLEQEGQQQPTK